jgi:hypothetical protein
MINVVYLVKSSILKKIKKVFYGGITHRIWDVGYRGGEKPCMINHA